MSSSDSSFSSAFSSAGAASAAPPAAAAPAAGAAPPAPPEGTEASFSEPEAISCGKSVSAHRGFSIDGAIVLGAYLVDVLALELRDEGLETGLIGLNTDGLKDSLDVGSGGGGVTTESEEEVGREVLHFDVVVEGLLLGRNRSAIDLT